MLHFLQHPALVIGMLDLLHLDDLLLLENLDRIESLIVLGLHKVYTTKTSRAQCSQYFEVSQGVFAFGLTDNSWWWRDGLTRRCHSTAIA